MNESNWTSSVWRSRVSRRGVIRGAAFGAAGLGGAALLGCGDSDDPGSGTATSSATGATGDPVRGGELRLALPQDNNTLDPAFSTSTPDAAITQATHDNLVLQQHDSSFKPMLAESLEPNEDLTEYVATLRPGVKFHHGKELEAKDVIMTFERLLDPAVGSPAAASVAAIESMEEVDPLTVKFILNGPSAFLHDALSIYQARIMPSDIDPSQYATELSGTGPFRLDEHRAGERTRFVRNEEYWDEAAPHLDAVTYFYMPEPVTRLEALKTGSVDVMFPLEPGQITSAESSGLRVSEQPSGSYLNLAMRVDTAPFDDIRVRRAFQALTDREFVQEAATYGRGVAGNDHPVPPFDPHFWEGQVQPGYSVEEAVKLLDAAGLRDMEITLHTSTVTPGIQELAVAYKELALLGGVTVNVNRAPEDSYWSSVWLVEPFTTVGWNGRAADEALSLVYTSGAPWNESYYENAEIDELLARARGIPDQEERTETYGQIEQILIDDVPRIVPAFKPVFLATTQNVGGLDAHPSNWLLLHNTWLNA